MVLQKEDDNDTSYYYEDTDNIEFNKADYDSDIESGINSDTDSDDEYDSNRDDRDDKENDQADLLKATDQIGRQSICPTIDNNDQIEE